MNPVKRPRQSEPNMFLYPLTGCGLTGFLKDWEKAREVLGDILEPAGARKTKP